MENNIKFLKGVGEKRALLYEKLEIKNTRDLLYYFPRTYIDLSVPCNISQAYPGEPCVLRARIVSKSNGQMIRKGLFIFKVVVSDDSSSLIISFFNSKYTVDSLKLDEEYFFYGNITGFGTRKEMAAPFICPLSTPTRFIPVYPLTHGISSKMIQTNVLQALTTLDASFPDPIPAIIRQKYGLCHLHYALKNIHIPENKAAIEIARNRLIFEEFFILSLSLSAIKTRGHASTAYQCQKYNLSPFTSALAFSLTNAQQKAINEVALDLCKPSPMNRLIQGDVGSGKTMVAAAAAFIAFQNGFQSALMAPTEILATQHYNGLRLLLEPLGMHLGLLTGSSSAKEKRATKAALASGEISLCIGTHALITDDVEFKDLALVITDEQHRFGVRQRAKLSEKSDNPHLLVMSATPIPRTLALIIYGDLEVSIIDELPPNRQPINTYVITPDKKQRAYRFIKEHLDRGLQAYIVCPLVEAGEIDTGLENAEEYADTLAKGYFCEYNVGVLHGKMKPKQKDAMMSAFSSGEIKLLVSTTVIEVGVDVPNAVIMMIENADRFGLSQLHQLRGRVGRGKEQSTCILVSGNQNEETKKRLELMHRTNDGFKVAEYDLKTRGPGDFFGKKQHGLPELKIANLSTNMDVLLQAQEASKYAYAHKKDFSPEERHLLNESILKIMLNN